MDEEYPSSGGFIHLEKFFGIPNYGQSCYLSALLVCLHSMEQIRDAYIDHYVKCAHCQSFHRAKSKASKTGKTINTQHIAISYLYTENQFNGVINCQHGVTSMSCISWKVFQNTGMIMKQFWQQPLKLVLTILFIFRLHEMQIGTSVAQSGYSGKGKQIGSHVLTSRYGPFKWTCPTMTDFLKMAKHQ